MLASGINGYAYDVVPTSTMRADTCLSSVASARTYKFTGKERDTESGLDNFGARYYASTMGRFVSPDWAANATAVPYANYGNPQSLNLYSYVRNNPTTTTDPDGHCCWEWAAPVITWIATRQWGDSSENQTEQQNTSTITPAQAAALQNENFAVSIIMAGMVGGENEGLSEDLVGMEANLSESSAGATSELASRAQEIQGALPEATQGRVTTAVGSARNADGSTSTLVSTCEGTLRPGQKAALKPGETAVEGRPRTHAEVNMLNHAKANGQTLESVAPSRPACSNC